MKKFFSIGMELNDLFSEVVTIKNAKEMAEVFLEIENTFVFEENNLNLFLRKNQTFIREKIQQQMYNDFRSLDFELHVGYFHKFCKFNKFKKDLENRVVEDFIREIQDTKANKKKDFAMKYLESSTKKR